MSLRRSGLRVAYRCLLLAGLVACAPPKQAEIVDYDVLTKRQLAEKHGGQLVRIVQPGDTLYSICFQAGLSVDQVAAWNGISDVRKLQVGQRLRLTQPIGFNAKKRKPSQQVSSAKRRIKKRRPKNVVRVPSSGSTGSGRSAEKQTAVAKKTKSAQVAKTAAKKPASTVKKAAPKPAKRAAVKPTRGVSTKPFKWGWPIRGTLLKRFNRAKRQDGIDIQGQKGQKVRATAAGEVVYAGDSLKGYRNLIIIKHNNLYLSAYSNNQKILVKDGQKVGEGQVIATLGVSNQGVAASHFQIRKDGTPINPMAFLK